MHDTASPPPRRHPTSVALAAYLTGACSPGSALLILNHARLCAECRQTLMQMGAIELPDQPLVRAWKRVGPGLEIAPIPGASGLGEAVYAIRANAGVIVETGAPLNLAEILVLGGGFTSAGVAFQVGDFMVLEGSEPTQLVADAQLGFMALADADAF